MCAVVCVVPVIFRRIFGMMDAHMQSDRRRILIFVVFLVFLVAMAGAQLLLRIRRYEADVSGTSAATPIVQAVNPPRFL